MPEAAYLQVLVQGGSFAALVVVMVWVGRFAVPKAIEVHEKTIDKHEVAVKDLTDKHEKTVKELVERFSADRKDLDDRHERELTKRDTAFEKLTAGLDQVTTQLESLHQRIDDALGHSIPPR